MGEMFVIGAYQFVGYHLVTHLLEQGYEVTGADWDRNPQKTRIIEEKKMEICRNANYTEAAFDADVIGMGEERLLFVSFYDALKGNKSGNIADIIQQLHSFIMKAETLEMKVLLFLPIEKENRRDEIIPNMNHYLGKNNVQLLYLPTIYGPWQHDCMAFEAGIRKKSVKDIESALETEYKQDAIYVKDLMDVIPQILKEDEKKILIKSKVPKQWLLCASRIFESEINIDTDLSDQDPNDAYVHRVLNTVLPEEGIRMQRQFTVLTERLEKEKPS